MPARGFLPSVTRLACVVVIAASLVGCGRKQPVSPVVASTGHNGVGEPAALTPDGLTGSQPGAAAENVDPTMQITLPRPSKFISSLVPPNFTVYFEVDDPDARSSRPLEYRYLLLDDPREIQIFVSAPDSLRRRDAPTFQNWSLIHGSRPQVGLSDLTLNKHYVVVLVAIDPEGGYSHNFTLDTNMLQFTVGFPQALGPIVQLSGDVVYTTYSGGLMDDPALAPHFTLPMDRASTIRWTTTPSYSDLVEGTRWALDPTKVGGLSPSPGREGGWSGWDLTNSAASVGPFATSGEHRFYVEARTKLGLLTRLLVILDVAPPAQVGRARTD